MPRSTDALSARLLDALDAELASAVELRRRLHAQPELAHEEHATAALVAEHLPEPCRTVAGTGRLCRVGAGAGRPVAVRAELDGLPLRERSGAPFSAHGETMHACGHDVHMAALVALARAARSLSDELPAPLLAVLQPSEEAYPSGAQELARGALAEEQPLALVAAHIHPEIAWGEVALDAGAVNASCDAFEITVVGEPAHGAYPHRGRDPVLALCEIVVSLHAQVGRAVDPLQPATLTVGVLEGGSAENVIPGRVRASGALRAHRPRERALLGELLARVCAGVAAAHGCTAEVQLTAGEPPLHNDAEIVAGARELLARAGVRIAPQWRSTGSDDFSFFAGLGPLAMAFVGLRGADGFVERPLHHPEMLPPDSAVGAVARAQAMLYLAGAARG